MANRQLIRSQVFPYHVVNRCNNREWFNLPQEVVWEIFTRELYKISIVYGALIHAFVLMANHYHLLISAPEADIAKLMEELQKSVSRTHNLISGRSGHLFQGRYYRSLIQSPVYYAYALKYVYRNPVKAGVTNRVEDYPFSTLHGLLGQSALPFPLHYPKPEQNGFSFVPFEFGDMLTWLNEPFVNELDQSITQQITKDIFELPDSILYP